MDRIEIKFFEMLELIKRMPNLTRLMTSSVSANTDVGLENGIDHVNDFVEDAYKEHYPLSLRLKLWIHPQCRNEAMAQLALASVAIAVLCPRFCYTKVPYFSREGFQRKLKATIADISNDCHRKTLERLLKMSVEHFN
ncbi:hypothetical protein EV175_004651 [Coemansia sp. RSA 1933]|nr:hypothetical protein EV175_004651 [Coemansia sp. RSA 1933]